MKQKSSKTLRFPLGSTSKSVPRGNLNFQKLLSASKLDHPNTNIEYFFKPLRQKFQMGYEIDENMKNKELSISDYDVSHF